MGAAPQANPRVWLAVGGAVFGTFMALLDVSVTNSSLPQIQGEIGATGTEGTWISTGYLVAEIIVIPLTGWLTRLLGLRAFLLWATFLFTFFSVMCGLANSLPEIIIGRVGQGLAGGAMIPASLTIIATRLTPAQRPAGLALYVSAALLAPFLGPVLGGWLTENGSWRWLFFMNLPTAIILVLLLIFGIERARPDWRQLGQADWFGIAGLASFLGGLTVVLEEGQRESWFDSPVIDWLTVMAAAGLIVVLISQVTHPRPVVKLKLLTDPGFLAVFVITTLSGAGVFTLLYIVPVFLGSIAGYNAQQTGVVAMYPGLSTLLLMPILMILMQRVDIRWLVAAGLIIFTIGCVVNLGLTPASVGGDFVLGQLIRGVGLPMVQVPLSQTATSGLAADDIPDGSALFSMARNLGGSLGLALTGILIDRRLAFHVAQLEQARTANSTVAQERIAQLASGFAQGDGDGNFATLRALRSIGGEIQRQALVMSFIDAIWLVGFALLLGAPLVLLMKRARWDPTDISH